MPEMQFGVAFHGAGSQQEFRELVGRADERW